MGQDKKQLAKLLDYVKDLYSNPDNKEFAAGIQSIVLNDMRSEPSRDTWSKQISEIYELCLKKNLREQAEDLYKDFPIIEIASGLVDYYIKMEDARRSNDFDSFGRYLYLQIELIVDTIIKDEVFIQIYEGIRKLKPITKYNYEEKKTIRIDFSQKGNDAQTVDQFLLVKKDNEGKTLGELGAIDKGRIVIYTICHNATVSVKPKEEFDALSGIYNVRNHESHSGVNMSDEQIRYYNGIIVDKTKNYLRFLGFLFDFIKNVSNNYPISEKLYTLSGISNKQKEQS